MMHYSVLESKDIQEILSQYGDYIVQSSKVLSGGSENTNYLVKTHNNAFVLTICEQKSTIKANELASLLEYLRHHDFVTSHLVKTLNGALTSVWCNKPVMLKVFIEGEYIEDIPNQLLQCLGNQLAKLHQIDAPNYLSQTVSYGLEYFDRVKLYDPESSFYIWLKQTQKYIESYIHPELPKAMIHSDVFDSNIIVNPDGKHATIMDFEEVCYYYRVFDIGMMIIGTCAEGTNVNLNKAASIIKGYQQEIKLLSVEIEALQAFTAYGAAAIAYWRHQNFNYVKVDPAMSNHYQAMQTLANTVMNFSLQEFKTGCNV